MAIQSINPFLSFAKSNDLTDDQIGDLWVGFDGSPDVHPLFDPTSPMATIVLGGKGSGKTHLFRYFSYPVQARSYERGDWLSDILKDRYVGVYTRASGLNCSRFDGKGIDRGRWAEIFRYYVELWLGQELLDVFSLVVDHVNSVKAQEAEIVIALTKHIDLPMGINIRTFSDLANFLRKCQRSLDRSVNDAAFTRKIDPVLRCSSGDLVFGFPKTLTNYLDPDNGIIFAYYIDECENLLEYQQRHVNTLLRDRQRPVTFRVGARSYGMRTYETDCAEGERIQEDSEYQVLRLDERMRKEPDRYGAFARELLVGRVAVSGSMLSTTDMDVCFSPAPSAGQAVTRAGDRPHLVRLRERLADIVNTLADEVVAAVRVDENPIVEKAAIFLFYQAVADGKSDLRTITAAVAQLVESYRNGTRPHRMTSIIDHYRGDFVAQMSRDARQGRGAGEDNHYTGLDDFILMSEGLPRSLLTIVGESVKSATFRSELPNAGRPVSPASQYDGVRYASDWFFSDVPQGGEIGEAIQLSISRLGELFRMNRFSDKPIECSLIAFSVCMDAVSRSARDLILEAERRSFLIRTASPQNDRFSNSIWEKYHLNRILCPKFDLPLGMRGAARLRTGAVDAIFGGDEKSFETIRDEWRRKLEWPFGRRDLESRRLF